MKTAVPPGVPGGTAVFCFTGATRPRALLLVAGGSAPGPRVLVAGAYPAPDLGCLLLGPPRPQTPGHFFLGEKVTKTPPGTPRTPLLPNRTLLDLIPGCHRITSPFGHLISAGLLVRLRLTPC